MSASLEGRTVPWQGDPAILQAVQGLLADGDVRSLCRRDRSVALFVLAVVCNWATTELCQTIPDPVEAIPLDLQRPRDAAADLLLSWAHRVSAAKGQPSIPVRSLAAVIRLYLSTDDDRQDAGVLLGHLREEIHADCKDVPAALPLSLDQVTEWMELTFAEKRACRIKIKAVWEEIERELPESNPNRQVFHGLAKVAWEFGYGAAWAKRGTNAAMRAMIGYALVAGNYQLAKRHLDVVLELPWRSTLPSHVAPAAAEWPMFRALAASARVRLIVWRPWSESLDHADFGLLLGMTQSLEIPADSPGIRVIYDLREAISHGLRRHVPLVWLRRADDPRYERRFLRGVWRSWWVALTVAIAVGFASLYFLPGWIATWLTAIVVTVALTGARRRATFVGKVRWVPATLAALSFAIAAAAPPVVLHALAGGQFTPIELVLLSFGALLNCIAVTLLVVSPFVRVKTGFLSYLFDEWGLPQDISDAFDEAVRMAGTR